MVVKRGAFISSAQSLVSVTAETDYACGQSVLPVHAKRGILSLVCCFLFYDLK